MRGRLLVALAVSILLAGIFSGVNLILDRAEPGVSLNEFTSRLEG